MHAYKFLAREAIAPFSGFEWPRSRAGAPGAWVETAGPVALCRRGIHACRLADLPHWLGEELWRVELDGEIVVQEDTVIASRGRLVGRVERWDPQLARAFAEACALRAREHAVGVLRETGLGREADALARATSMTDLLDAARVGYRAAEAAAPAPAVLRVIGAGTATAEHAAAPLDTPAYVSWAACAGYTAAVAAGHRVPRGEIAERELQARWLADQLELLE